MKLPGRRRKLLVDKLQLKLLSINLIYTAVMVLVFVTIIFGPLVVKTLDESTSFEDRVEAGDRMLVLHKNTWPAVFVIAALFSFHSILYTHRIAGPLYRFRNVFAKIGSGDLTVRSGVRTKDYLGAESDTINRMIDGLNERVGEIRMACQNVRDPRCKLHSTSDVVERQAALAVLEQRLEILGTSIAKFKLAEGDLPLSVATPVEATEREQLEIVPTS